MTLHVEIQFEETFRASPCLEVCIVQCIQEAGGAKSLMSTHDLLGKRQTLGTILIASRMTASQLQCQIYIQLAKEIYYQRQDGPWHWVNSVRHFYQFHQLFPAVTLFDCPTERTFFCEFDAIFVKCVS